MRRVRSTSFCIGLWLIACASHSDRPGLPVTNAPPYKTWWHDIEQCADTSGDMLAVRFEIIPTTRNVGVEIKGQTAGPGVVFAGSTTHNVNGGFTIRIGSPWVTDSGMVRHEMLHALRWTSHGHDPEYFQRKCKALVTCVSLCLSDTTSLPPRR